MTKFVWVGVVAAGLAAAAYAGGGAACGWSGAKADKADKAGKAACAVDKAACGTEAKIDKVKVGKIDTAALNQKIQSGAAFTLIDARTAKWDDGRRLPGAISMSAESTDEQIVAALPDKAASIVTYCSNEKCPASDTLAARLIGLGYENVVKYPQGLDGWAESGHGVVDTRSAKPGQS
ncbi:MAG TPA: rhodanese-like domain-containing protein [Kiritimatiellia bacterium]|nr:rhodanese-like domain-containing protein [Kiritimatiellia bacterium]